MHHSSGRCVDGKLLTQNEADNGNKQMKHKQWLLSRPIRGNLTLVPESQDEANTGTVDWPSLTYSMSASNYPVLQNMLNNFTRYFGNEGTIKIENLNFNYF